MARLLVDCPCEVTVYRDGSGIEMHYCPRHRLADDLETTHIRALTILANRYDTTPGRYLRSLIDAALLKAALEAEGATR